ncbi:MAG TPA: hypothetical protein VF832_20095, partial [Longimicrobiales bacterium]
PSEGAAMPRSLSTLLLVPLLAASLAPPARAQTTSLPSTYSFLGTTSLMSPEMQVKVNRVGARELVELTLPESGGTGSGLHQRLLYDFDRHLVYSTDLLTKRCTVQQYESSYAPMFDPIGASKSMLAGMPAGTPPAAGRETINGIATRVVEVALAEGQGRSRVWLDEKHGFIVRLAIGLKDEAPTTRLEIRQLSYAPSPAALFAPPRGCSRMAGVATAEGGHAETTVEAEVPPQTRQLEPAAPPDTQAVTSVPEAPPPPARAQVTSVRLRLVPARHRGPCPGTVDLVGEFTTDGPGTVWYEFLAGAVSSSPEGTLTFKAAGTQTVTVHGAFQEAPQVREVMLMAAMQDERGQHGPEPMASDPVTLDIVCTAH